MAKRQTRRTSPPIEPAQQEQGVTPDRRMLNWREAAAYLGCTQSILGSLMWHGIIPHKGEHPSRTFSQVELDAWLAFWGQEATADTLITLVGEYVRQHDYGLSGRLFLQGLLRPEEQAKYLAGVSGHTSSFTTW
jgi:hypothetical protein